MFRRKWKEMSWGELLDKRSILQVKAKFIPEERLYIQQQLNKMHEPIFNYIVKKLTEFERQRVCQLMGDLYKNNYVQWQYEDHVLSYKNPEAAMQAAKMSRKYNLKRSKIKQEIDTIFKEEYLEVKKYAKLEGLNGV